MEFMSSVRSAALLFRTSEFILSIIGTDSGLSQAPLETFRDANSPVAKLYNWNLLTPVLKALAIEVDQDDKALIVAGGTSHPTSASVRIPRRPYMSRTNNSVG